MKRTTYIFIGLLVSGLMVIVATIIFISMSGKPYREDVNFGGDEQVTMDLNGVHVVKVFVSQDGVPEERHVFVNGEMKIESIFTSVGKEQISYPKGKYLNVIQKNDTLFMKLDFSSKNISDKYHNRGFIYSTGFDVKLAVDSLAGIITDTDGNYTLEDVPTNAILQVSFMGYLSQEITDTDGLKLNLKGIDTDSLFVRGRYNILLDSCQIHSLDIQGNRLEFRARNSIIENFYLNLDGVWKWTFENTEVGTEYLSGSDRHSNNLQKGECKRVVWTPLTGDARLQVNVREKAAITITPE